MRRFAQYIDAEDGIPGQADNATTADSAATAIDAEMLDGISANQLLRVAFGSTADAPDADGNAVTATITAPQAGWVILSGSIAAEAVFGGTADTYNCWLAVDGGQLEDTERVSVVHKPGGDHTDNARESCDTTGVHQVTAGSHTIALTINNRSSAFLFQANVWALFVPFDGLGNTP
jgi:hypothetical protein